MNDNFNDWIISELKAGKKVIVPEKIHEAVINDLIKLEVDPALLKNVIAKDVRKSDLNGGNFKI